jgi:hypothetical protein
MHGTVGKKIRCTCELLVSTLAHTLAYNKLKFWIRAQCLALIRI